MAEQCKYFGTTNSNKKGDSIVEQKKMAVNANCPLSCLFYYRVLLRIRVLWLYKNSLTVTHRISLIAQKKEIYNKLFLLVNDFWFRMANPKFWKYKTLSLLLLYDFILLLDHQVFLIQNFMLQPWQKLMVTNLLEHELTLPTFTSK